MTIGDRIKCLREQQDISQTELAYLIQSTKQNVYKYENGIICNIPSDKIEAIAKALHTTPAYLMGWDIKETSHIPTTKQTKSLRSISRLEDSQITSDEDIEISNFIDFVLSKRNKPNE